jgi:hypothetical protein
MCVFLCPRCASLMLARFQDSPPPHLPAPSAAHSGVLRVAAPMPARTRLPSVSWLLRWCRPVLTRLRPHTTNLHSGTIQTNTETLGTLGRAYVCGEGRGEWYKVSVQLPVCTCARCVLRTCVCILLHLYPLDTTHRRTH